VRACVYGADGIVAESYLGNSALAFALAYDGPLTLRISEPHEQLPAVEIGDCPPAGYHIDGTLPAPPAKLTVWDIARSMSPADARDFIVGLMKRRCRRYMARYRDANDADFGDADMLAEAIAARDELKAAVIAASQATSEAELRAAWDAMLAVMEGGT
jgi:hypothetical protein